ncbi:MAG: UbiA family prenyltransferase [Pseudomonadota bacterium]
MDDGAEIAGGARLDPGVRQVYVDLDGTLVRTDMFVESAFRLLKKNPLNAVLILLWLLRGRAFAKAEIARRVEIDPALLPYDQTVLEALRAMRAEGRALVLATAAENRFATAIAAHLDLFDDVLASDGARNLKGRRKLEAIKEHSADAPFAYFGDSPADRPIWDAAAHAVLVGAPSAEEKRLQKAGVSSTVLTKRSSAARAFAKEMRPHQWAKNVLVFVPLFTSHSYADVSAVATALAAFVAYSLCASGVYFLNDLLDLDADRAHVKKRFRPLASGDLPIALGVVGAAALPLIAFATAVALTPPAFVAVLAAYFATTNLYSFFLKTRSTVDVMTLAILYTLRVIGGAAAIAVPLSSWLVGFSIFVFVSLAYLKRYIEVAPLEGGQEKARGRGYTGSDAETMFALGIANMTAAVLFLALYVSSDEVTANYATPDILWALCFLMLFWGNRIWVGARRGKITDDPVVFAIKDKVSRLVGVLFGVTVLAARFIAL